VRIFVGFFGLNKRKKILIFNDTEASAFILNSSVPLCQSGEPHLFEYTPAFSYSCMAPDVNANEEN
jgi:hypothetical protein